MKYKTNISEGKSLGTGVEGGVNFWGLIDSREIKSFYQKYQEYAVQKVEKQSGFHFNFKPTSFWNVYSAFMFLSIGIYNDVGLHPALKVIRTDIN